MAQKQSYNFGMTHGMIESMSYAKIAISIDQGLLNEIDRMVKKRAFQSRSQAFQEAITEKLNRIRKTRLATESSKLNQDEERSLAEEGVGDLKEWPKY